MHIVRSCVHTRYTPFLDSAWAAAPPPSASQPRVLHTAGCAAEDASAAVRLHQRVIIDHQPFGRRAAGQCNMVGEGRHVCGGEGRAELYCAVPSDARSRCTAVACPRRTTARVGSGTVGRGEFSAFGEGGGGPRGLGLAQTRSRLTGSNLRLPAPPPAPPVASSDDDDELLATGYWRLSSSVARLATVSLLVGSK